MASRLLTKKLADNALLSSLKRSAVSRHVLQRRPLSSTAVPVEEGEKKDAVEVQNQRRGRRSPFSRRWREIAPFSLAEIWDPFPVSRTLTQMMDNVNRIIGDMLPLRDDVFPENFRLPYDVMEDEKSYKIRLDMPGLGKEHVNVGIEDGSLVIRGERGEEAKDGEWESRSYGSFNTRIVLPDNCQFENTKAEMKNGVLHVCIPKAQEDRSVITVNVE